MEFCYSGKDIIIRYPFLYDVGFPFNIIGLFQIFFYLILFSSIIGHNAALSLLY